MAMTDAELQAWIDEQVDEAIEADKQDIEEFISSGQLDRELDESFAEREAEVAEMEKAEEEKNKAE